MTNSTPTLDSKTVIITVDSSFASMTNDLHYIGSKRVIKHTIGNITNAVHYLDSKAVSIPVVAVLATLPMLYLILIQRQ